MLVPCVVPLVLTLLPSARENTLPRLKRVQEVVERVSALVVPPLKKRTYVSSRYHELTHGFNEALRQTDTKCVAPLVGRDFSQHY